MATQYIDGRLGVDSNAGLKAACRVIAAAASALTWCVLHPKSHPDGKGLFGRVSASASPNPKHREGSRKKIDIGLAEPIYRWKSVGHFSEVPV